MPMGADTEPRRHIVAIDHIQLAMPGGGEDEARQFYGDVLGFVEVPKPAGLTGRGGCWFASADGTVAVHLGVEDAFRPARKAHPAFVVRDLDSLRQRLNDTGAEIVEDDSIPVERCYTADPFGNRIELVAAGDRGFTTRGASGEGGDGGGRGPSCRDRGRDIGMTVPPAFAALPRHRAALEAVLTAAAADSHVLGVVLIGSFAAGEADEVSDVDLVLLAAEGEFDTVWQRRSSYSAGALRTWDVGPLGAPIAAHKWMTPELVLVECLFAQAGSGARLGEPFLVVAGAASVVDSLRRRGPIPRAEVDGGEYTGDPAEWLYDALKLCLRGDPGAAVRLVDLFRQGGRSTTPTTAHDSETAGDA